MKFRRFVGLGLSLIMMFSSLNIAFADETAESYFDVFEQEIDIADNDAVLSDAAVEVDLEVDEEAVIEVEVAALADMADTAYLAYAVEGGNIYYDPNTGEIKDCDESVTSAVIPSEIDGVRIISIGRDAFYGCEILNSVVIYEGIETISDYSFEGCKGLVDINLPNSITSIGNGAFEDCQSLKDFSIPQNVTTLGAEFLYNTQIKEITIPKSIVDVGYNYIKNQSYFRSGPFSGCSKLTKVTFENGTTKIPDNILAFSYDTQSITYKKSNIAEIEIPDTVSEIGNYSFVGCTNLTTLELPIKLEKIGYSAFRGCSGIVYMNLPDNISEIGSSCFYDCSNLCEINIPLNLSKLCDEMFYNCKNIKTINIGSNVKYIGNNVFSNSGVEKLNIPDSVTYVGNMSDMYNLEMITLPSYLDQTNCPMFRYCSKLKEIVIPKGIKVIGERTFQEDSCLEKVTIPYSVTTIGFFAFRSCGFKEIIIPNSVTTIESEAFENCYSLQCVIIPNSVKSISLQAFCACDNLTSVIISEGVTSIGYKAFSGCGDLKIVIPNSVTKINEPFSSMGTVTIYCQADSYAETYAKENNIPYIIVGAGSIGNDGSKLELPTSKSYGVGTQTTVLNCLTATLTPHTNDKSDIVWSSSNTDVVEVIPSTGIDGTMSDSLWCNLNCKAIGTSIITVSNSKGASASCLVTVTEGEAENNNNYGLNNIKSSKTKEEQLINAIDEYETALAVYEKNVVQTLENTKVSDISEETVYQTLKPTIAGMISVPKDAQEACYRAIYDTIAKMSYSKTALDKINMGADQITISTSVIKQIANAYASETNEYSYGQYDITVSIMGFNGSYFGQLTYKPKKRNQNPQTVGFTSSQEETAKIMADYLNQVKVMEKNALDEALISTIDFFNEQVGIDKYIKSKYTKIIDKYTPQLNNLGLGELVSLVEDCKTVCTHVKKLNNLDTSDLASCYDEISALSKLELGSTTKVSTRVVNKAYKNLITCRNNMITAATNYISNTPKEETVWDKITSWKCPVDIIVYDANGNEIGSVIGDEITCNSDDIMIKKTGDLKQVYTSHGIEVSFKIIATDYGLLNVTVEDYSNNTVVGRQNFYNIPLDINDELTTSAISNKVENMTIYTPMGDRIDDEYISSNIDAVINVSISSAENGSVENSGEYARGDAVRLKAVPNDGYRFVGWYNSDEELLSKNIIYNFTAYEDVALKAAFAEEISDYVKGDINDDGKVTAIDAMLIAQLASGKRVDEVMYSKADLNSDGKVTAIDAMLAARFASGKITSF